MHSKTNLKTPKIGQALYVLFQGGVPIEATSYPSRAVNRAKEWSTINNPCVITGCKVEYLFGDIDDGASASTEDAEDAAQDHESACGLGDDCPRKAPNIEAGVQPLAEPFNHDISSLIDHYKKEIFTEEGRKLVQDICDCGCVEFEDEEPTKPEQMSFNFRTRDYNCY